MILNSLKKKKNNELVFLVNENKYINIQCVKLLEG